MLNILLIDNDLNTIINTFDIFSNFSTLDYKIKNICQYEEELVTYVKDFAYDLIIINLNMNKINPYMLLNTLKERNLLHKTIAFSELSQSETLHLMYQYYKVFNVFSLPIDLNRLKKSIEKICINAKDKNEKTEITEILELFRFNKTSEGYKYIIDCLNICIRNDYKKLPKLSIIFEEIIKERNLDLETASHVEWNIQKSVQTMRQYTSPFIMDKYFPFLPSPKLFLNTILAMYYEQNKEKGLLKNNS